MTVYGNECTNGFDLFANGDLVGTYTSPVDIVETYIGEHYVTHTNMGILGGRQAWQTVVRRGDGVEITRFITRDVKLNVVFTPPTTEDRKWTRTWQSANAWFGSWVFVAGSIDYDTIPRYFYNI